MTSLTRIGLGTVVALSLFSGMAMAADKKKGGDDGIASACKWDIIKFAAMEKPGNVKAALLKNVSKLSADCKKAIDGAK